MKIEQDMPIIDCFGDYCPIPILKIKNELKKIKVGESFIIVSDHSCVINSAQSSFSEEKVKLEFFEPMNGVWEIKVTKLI